ncbi:MAG: hypothetical protein ACJ782_18850 [Actinomycetota bacterium]
MDDLLEFTDEELTALALAADPVEPLAEDAVPRQSYLGTFPELLPSWYMPAPGSYRRTRTRAAVVTVIIVSLLVINALGLCITSGHLEIPF